MKRTIILLLLSMALFSCAATAEETQVKEIPVTEEAGVTLFDVRYYFEHRMLPQEFYEAPEKTMDSLLEKGLYERWNRYTADSGFDSPYPAESFSVREIPRNGDVRILVLAMPKPEKTLLCYRIYLCLDPESGTAMYFTAEYDIYEGFFDESCLICGWKQDRTHQYFRETRIIPDSNDPEYEKALAEEVSVIRDLMQEQIEADRRESLIQLI